MELIRKTIENDEAYLRQVSKLVDFKDEYYKKEIKLLEKYCLEVECFALAAVQVGILKRIVYLKNTTLDIKNRENKEYNEAKVLINPVIKWRKGHTKYWEACYSCGENMGLVSRPYIMEVEFFDIYGIKHNQIFEGFEATVVSHELDHLDGILHMDIAEEVLNLPREERKKIRETHDYEIISKTCNYDEILVNKKKV